MFPALHKVIFQSTPPVKAATRHNTIAQHKPCISIHAAREGGDFADAFGEPIYVISIHAAREGGDIGHIPEEK